MSVIVKLYDLAPSPNSMKARIALNYKEIPFEKIPVDVDSDRAEVIKASGQPLTPVLVHGDRVIWDSAAILRYLEGNFRSTRPIFSTDYMTMVEIERWEAVGKQLISSVGMIFGQFFAPEKDPSIPGKASAVLHENSAKLEERLAAGSWLVGDSMTAADISCAPMAFYGTLTAEHAAISPLHKFFHESLKLGDGRDRTRAWVKKVMAWDK